MPWSFLKLLCVLLGLPLLGLALSSCSMASPGYSLRTDWPDKDVVVVSIYLHEKLDVEEYRAIADAETAELLAGPVPAGVPIYEVRFEFFLPEVSPPMHRRIARLSLYPRRGETATLSAAPPEVVLY